MSEVHADTRRLERAHLKDPSVPKPVLIAIGILLAATILLVATVRMIDDPRARSAYATIAVEPMRAAVTLVFRDREDGAVVAENVATGTVQSIALPEEGGFVRGVLRGMMRARRARDVAPTEPFRLVWQEDGDFYLEDPSTRTAVDLRAFGPTNLATFAAMLPPEGVTQ